jgi:hypothetical protein
MGFLANLKGPPADPDQSDYDAATATRPLADVAACTSRTRSLPRRSSCSIVAG